jgi:hypothetical protein
MGRLQIAGLLLLRAAAACTPQQPTALESGMVGQPCLWVWLRSVGRLLLPIVVLLVVGVAAACALLKLTAWEPGGQGLLLTQSACTPQQAAAWKPAHGLLLVGAAAACTPRQLTAWKPGMLGLMLVRDAAACIYQRPTAWEPGRQGLLLVGQTAACIFQQLIAWEPTGQGLLLVGAAAVYTLQQATAWEPGKQGLLLLLLLLLTPWSVTQLSLLLRVRLGLPALQKQNARWRHQCLLWKGQHAAMCTLQVFCPLQQQQQYPQQKQQQGQQKQQSVTWPSRILPKLLQS